MAQTGFNAHFEWIRSAEKAVKEGNSESAARLFLHVSTYYGVVNDEPNRKLASWLDLRNLRIGMSR
jgi:hypothetical protein